MADQFLQTLTPEAQAQYDAAERKKQIALMMMKANPEGLQPMKLGTIASRVHPLSFIADAASKHFAGKEFEKSADAQGKLKTEGAANYSGAVNDFMGQNGPSGDPSAIARLLTNPSPAVQQFGKDTQSKMAAAAEKEAERMLKQKEAAAKGLFDAGHVEAALSVFNNGIPKDFKPTPLPSPEIKTAPGPNGQPLTYAETVNRKGERNIHNLGGGTSVSVTNQMPGAQFESAAAKSLGSKVPEVLEAASTGAKKAIESLQSADRITELLKDPATLTGFGAGPLTGLAAIGAALGFQGNDIAGKTQSLLGEQATQTLSQVRRLPGAITEKERPFLEMAAAGKIDWTPEAIQRLADIARVTAHNELLNYQKQYNGASSQPGAEAGASMYPFPKGWKFEADPKKYEPQGPDSDYYRYKETPSAVRPKTAPPAKTAPGKWRDVTKMSPEERKAEEAELMRQLGLGK